MRFRRRISRGPTRGRRRSGGGFRRRRSVTRRRGGGLARRIGFRM
nr:MAG TPA: hypothetical protein [Microviridae sp.]